MKIITRVVIAACTLAAILLGCAALPAIGANYPEPKQSN